MVGACSPSYLEAETGESLEPGRQRLQWAEIVSLHSHLGNKSKTSSKTKKKSKVTDAGMAMKTRECFTVDGNVN